MLNKVKKLFTIYRNDGLSTATSRLRQYLSYETRQYFLRLGSIAPHVKRILGKKLHQQLLMYSEIGYWPNIRDPVTFNEKIMHRKVFTDDDIFSMVEDKWRVRDYVRDKVGDEILTEVYTVTDDPEDIPFESLPDTFVVKPTHLSGSVILVDEDERVDPASVKKQCREWLETTHGTMLEEYWYRDIEPQILVEERLQDGDNEVPLDYKLFVFDGQVEYIEVDFDRYTHHTRRFYDTDWNTQEFQFKFPMGPDISEPAKLDEMIEIAETLGENFDFIRVDLYQPDGDRIVFGEMTVGPESGSGRFVPREYDYKLGSLWG